jgi:DNA-binding response OmpR family regulator
MTPPRTGRPWPRSGPCAHSTKVEWPPRRPGSILSTVMSRILVVVHDPSLLDFIGVGLRTAGFDVATARDAGAGLAAAADADLLILDLPMPEQAELAGRVRERGTPVLFLSPRNAGGARLPAEACMTKPFGFMVLVTRIHAVLRRAQLTGVV